MVPNLFILGAPKCGTSALFSWLAEHPSVFPPTSKEPHYFTSEYCLTPNRNTYEALFADWSVEQRWAIDASVWSLYSPYAVGNILMERPDAHFIVMLRDPLEMIPSMHRQQLFNANEFERDLRNALSLNDRRAAGEPIKMRKSYPSDHLAYFQSCALGWQVSRLFKAVASDRVHIVLYDDLKQSPADVLFRVQKFLEITSVSPRKFKKINKAKVRKFPVVDAAVKTVGDWKHRSGIKTRVGALAWLRAINRKEKPISELDENLRCEIQARLSEDVALLGECIKRDLSNWLGNKSSASEI